MAGYDGYSKSNNAIVAESEGLRPLSRINGAPPWAIKIAGKLLGPREWHHTSSRYNRTDYYDARAIVFCARSLVKQYGSATAATAAEQKRDDRQNKKWMAAARRGPLRLRLRCLVWDRGARSTGLDYREFLQLLRTRGPITIAARDALATELAEAALMSNLRKAETDA